MYTGKLGVHGAEALLRVRRFGEELQIEGCVAACDAALAALIGSRSSAPADRLAGVVDLFLHRALLPAGPGPELHPMVHMLLNGCREALVRCKPAAASALSAGDGPSLGELLAWAFLDVPTLLSDRGMREQMRQLPQESLEAMLGCDALATDDEATVLLMLAHWLKPKQDVTKAARERLCRLIRVHHLSHTYLHVILPQLPWFPISPEEHRFVCVYAHVSEAEREHMRKMCAVDVGPRGFDTSCAWYSAGPRPQPASGAGRAVARYEWHIREQDLKTVLLAKKGPSSASLYGQFGRKGSGEVVARGFKWRPEVSVTKGSDKAGVYMWCELSAALGITNPGALVGLVCPGPMELKIYRWDGDAAAAGAAADAAASGSGGGAACGSAASDIGGGADAANGGWKEAWSAGYADKFVRIAFAMGKPAALDLAASPVVAAPMSPQPPQTPGQDASGAAAGDGGSGAASTSTCARVDCMAAWAPYLHEGRLHGVMQWTCGGGGGNQQ